MDMTGSYQVTQLRFGIGLGSGEVQLSYKGGSSQKKD